MSLSLYFGYQLNHSNIMYNKFRHPHLFTFCVSTSFRWLFFFWQSHRKHVSLQLKWQKACCHFYLTGNWKTWTWPSLLSVFIEAFRMLLISTFHTRVMSPFVMTDGASIMTDKPPVMSSNIPGNLPVAVSMTLIAFCHLVRHCDSCCQWKQNPLLNTTFQGIDLCRSISSVWNSASRRKNSVLVNAKSMEGV